MSIAWLTGSPVGLSEPSVIAYSEKETYSSTDVPSASVTLMCPWSQRHGVLANILNNALQWPYATDNPMYAIGGSVLPQPGSKTSADGHGNAYPNAHLEVNFGWMQLDSGGGPGGEGGSSAIYAETLTPNGQMIKLNPKIKGAYRYKWDTDTLGENNRVEEASAPSKLIIGFDYVMRWARLTTIPAAVLTLIDHCNNANVVSPTLGYTFAAQTLLLTAVNVSRSFSADGTVTQSLELHFSWRQNTWNKFWNPLTDAWSNMYHESGTNHNQPVVVYPTGNFAALMPVV